MGCGTSSFDPDVQALTQKINASIQNKTTLQYQISQLKFLQEVKKAYPDIKDVKEAQIQNLKLSKEIKDTENLLVAIRNNEMQTEDIKILEETYEKLQRMLEERDSEIQILDEEVQHEIDNLEENKENLIELNEECEKLKKELQELTKSEKFKTILSLEETILQLEDNLEQRSSEIIAESPNFEDRNAEKSPRRNSITKFHQQLIYEVKRKSELEGLLKEVRAKIEEKKESLRNETLRRELYELECEEKEIDDMIESARLRKLQLETGKSRVTLAEKKESEANDLDLLERRFESSISSLMSGVGFIRNAKEVISEDNKKLKTEIAGIIGKKH